jgi:methyl-accepting chemotaxis protein
VRGEAESLLQNLAKQVATEIERNNSQAVQAAHLMALAQESGGLFGNRLESIELARRVLKESPEFTGAYFGYEPNADGNDADYLKRYYIVHRANQEERVRRYLIDQQIGPVHFHDNP